MFNSSRTMGLAGCFFLLLSVSCSTAESTQSGAAELPAAGRLAVLEEDGNIVILEQGEDPYVVTADAHTTDTQHPEAVMYSNPTWAPNGWLSFVKTTTPSTGEPETLLLALPPSRIDPVTLLDAHTDPYIYGYWSPSPCDTGPACATLAYLINDNEGVALHLVQVDEHTTSSSGIFVQDSILGRSAPFFYSWAPDGHAMAWFVQQNALATYDLDNSQITRLPQTPGLFMSPAWSPTDDRLLVAEFNKLTEAELWESELLILNGDQLVNTEIYSDTPLYFQWSPDGEYISWTTGGDPLDPIKIRAINRPGSDIVTAVDNVVAYFWSPDSRYLAIVALEPVGLEADQDVGNPMSMIFTWWTVELATGATHKIVRFYPTPEQFDLFRHFDQYAQSHRLWSPDSRYIVFAELAERGSRTLPGSISLIDVTQPDEAPLTLMEGHQAIFSFDP